MKGLVFIKWLTGEEELKPGGKTGTTAPIFTTKDNYKVLFYNEMRSAEGGAKER